VKSQASSNVIQQWWRGLSRRQRTLITLVVIAVVLLASFLVDRQATTGAPGSGASTTTTTSTPHFGVQLQTTGCVVSKGLEDSRCTPGAILSVTAKQICVPGYASSTRNVPQSEKNQVYAEYGIKHHTSGQYEVDHLVSLELGGSNDIANLWPEAATPTPGFHQKDRVESYLHTQICAGALTLQTAQDEIATNWIAVYNQMPGSDRGGAAIAFAAP